MFLNVSVLNTLDIFTDLKGLKYKNIICTMEDVRGDHPLWESIPLDNCQGIKGILVVICRGVDLSKRHRLAIFDLDRIG